MVDKRKIIVIVGVAGALGLMYYLGTKKKVTTTTPAPPPTTTTISPPTTTTTTTTGTITPPTTTTGTTTGTTTTTTSTTTTTTGGGGGGTYYGRSWFIEQAWQDWYNSIMKNAPTDYDRSQVQYYLNKYEDKLKQIIGGFVDWELAHYVDEQQIQTYHEDILKSVEFDIGIAYSTNGYNIFSKYPCYTDYAYMVSNNPQQAYQLWPYWLIVGMTLSYMAGDTTTFNNLKQQFESQYKCNVCNALGKPCVSPAPPSSYTVYINNQCSTPVTVYYTDPNGNSQTFNPPSGTSTIVVKADSTVTVKDASGNTILQQQISFPTTLLLCTTTTGGGGGGGGGTTTQTYTVTVQNYCDLNAWVYYTDANGNQQQQFVYIGSVATVNVKAGSTVTIVDETGNTVYTSSPINSNTTIKLCSVLGQCKTCS